MNVPLLDLSAQYRQLQPELEAATLAALRDGRYVLGPAVSELESALAGYLGVKHVIACASGSDALLLALMALDIGPGDEVITTPFTFFATVSAITRLGAKPVFVDIDPATFNIQVSGLKSQVSSRTKAIIPVHLFGQCADMEPLLKTGVPIIEDACQAIGAKYRGQKSESRSQESGAGPQSFVYSPQSGVESKKQLSTLHPPPSTSPAWLHAGAMGTIGTFSFYPTKNLGGAGDGGALSTNDDALATKLRQLRNHGMEPRYYHTMVGINSRLDSLQAAILKVKLPHLDAWADGRRRNASRYNQLLKDLPSIVLPSSDLCTASPKSKVSSLQSSPTTYHVFNQYTIRVKTDHGPQTLDLGTQKRDALRAHLQANGISTEIYYPVPLHLQKCFAFLGYKAGDFPEAERAATEVISLPIYPELTGEQIDYVAATVASFVKV